MAGQNLLSQLITLSKLTGNARSDSPNYQSDALFLGVLIFYTMEKQPDGSWRIAAVQLVPTGEISS